MPFRFRSRLAVSIFLLVLNGLPLLAHAEIDKGMVVGWNRSDWDPDTAATAFRPRDGFCAGAFLGTAFSPHWGMRGEILYSQKGAATTGWTTDENGEPLGEVDTTYRVDYLEIPLLITFSIPTAGAVTPIILAGAAVDFQLSARKTARFPSGIDIPFDSEQDIGTMTSTDFGLVLAGGIDIRRGARVINLQIRYVRGLEDVYAGAGNRTLSLVAGFGI